MSLKLCFNSEIHRVSKLPVNFNALISHSQALFTSKLPIRWALEYIDEENDRVMIASDHDYQSLLEDVGKGKSVKIFITEKSEQSSFVVENYEKILEAEPEPVNQPQQTKIEQAELREESKVPEAQAQTIRFAPQLKQLKEIEPLSPITKSAEQKAHHKYKALRLMKKLSSKDLSKEDREKFEAKLTQCMAKLNPEDLQWVTQQANCQSSEKLGKVKGEKEKCKPHLKYKAAGLLKKLSRKDLPIEEKEEKEKKLKACQAKMTPEDYQWAVEHATNLPATDQSKAKKLHAKCKAAHLLRKISNPEISKEDREKLEKKLSKINSVLTPEEIELAAQQASTKIDDEDCRKPNKYKVRNILRRLMFEPELSPDEKQDLEKKLSELKVKMPLEELDWVDEKIAKFQEKLKKIQSKRNKNLKEKITTFLQDSASQIAGFIVQGEKLEKPGKVLREFADVFESLTEEQRKEINTVMKGVPQKIADMETERKKHKQEKRLARAQNSKSRSKSRPQKSDEEKPKRKGFFGRKRESTDKIEKPLAEEPKYQKGVSRKADSLKEIFPEADIEKLLEFVAANNKLSTEELVESYLANKK
jgi:hypothetical protein